MQSQTSQRRFFIAFTLFWSLATSIVLAFVLYALINQCRTLSFSQTRGTIDSINRTVNHDSKGNASHGINVAYHYIIGQQRFDSTRVRFGAGSSNDNWANATLQKFPARSHPTVYYNPSNPEESVLIAGPQGQDFFLLLFITPFAITAIFMWTALMQMFLPHGSPRSFHIRERGPILRLRPSPLLPIASGGTALGCAAFLSSFIVVFLLGGFHPALHTMQIVWTLLAILALATTFLTAVLRSLGHFDVTLNDATRTVTKRNLVIPYSTITAIHVSNKGRIKDALNSFLVRIHYTHNNTPCRLTIKSRLPTFPIATRLATYLALHLNTPIYDLDENLLLPAPSPSA